MAVNIYDELAALEARIAKLESAAAPRMRIAAVSYFRSPTLWAACLAGKPALCLINPGSGPGTVADQLYVAQVPKNRAAGVATYGYTHTRYGARSLAEVKADVLNHKAWYGVDGVFIDTTSNKVEHVPYYADLCAFIKGHGLKVCLNPGTNGPEAHAQMADHVMVTETFWGTYKNQARPAWEANYPGKLWHCIHECPSAYYPKAVDLARSRGAGLLFVTDDLYSTDKNPYNTLPTYWSGLCALVAP